MAICMSLHVPRDMVAILGNNVDNHSTVWDCGGNRPLMRRFREVHYARVG